MGRLGIQTFIDAQKPLAVQIVVPWASGQQVTTGTASVFQEKWTCPDSQLLRRLNCIHLASGHHGDRDLELAQKAVYLLGGKIIDNRPKNSPLPH